jgi:hypothetical protein
MNQQWSAAALCSHIARPAGQVENGTERAAGLSIDLENEKPRGLSRPIVLARSWP